MSQNLSTAAVVIGTLRVNLYKQILSGILSECQTLWSQIRPDLAARNEFICQCSDLSFFVKIKNNLIKVPTVARLGMSVTTQGSSGRHFVPGL